MRNGKLFFLLLIVVTFVMNLVLIGLAFSFARRSQVSQTELREAIGVQLGISLTNIVDRIILDVGLPGRNEAQSPSTAKLPTDANQPEESYYVPAEIKTIEGEVAYINGQRFFVGDVISPYGVLAVIGKDMAVLLSASGGTPRIIARPLPVPIETVPERSRTSATANVGTAPKDGKGQATAS